MIIPTTLPTPRPLLCALLLSASGLAFLPLGQFSATPLEVDQSIFDYQTVSSVSSNPNTIGSVTMVLPPPNHPRLYLRPCTIGFYAERMRDPRFARWSEKVFKSSKSEWNGELPTGSESNYDPKLHGLIEACALRYILEGNRELGQRAVFWLLRVLPQVTFPEEQDITRAMGATIHTAAIVYDWCHPLLSGEDKRVIIAQMKRIAGQMEVGYPPVRGGNLVGHIGEAEIFRDQLAAGIAVYDEDPEIYQLAAGRLFAELLPGREFFYPSHWHHQGSSYGKYRLAWELWAAAIFKTMTGREVFSSHQTRLAEAWLYMQRPDGHMLPDGDVAGFAPQNNARYRPDWALLHIYLLTTFLSGDAVLAGVLSDTIRQHEDFTEGLAYFLFARPDLETAPLNKLPRAKYFPEPAGRMVVRTGWDMSESSGDLIVEMKISPWNFNNHQHLDAGAFQIWCRGALASDFGFYQGSGGGYGGPHWLNYYTRTIAHNTITVLDPNERFEFQGRQTANDGGQHRPNGGREPRDLEELKSAGHRVGRVISHRLGGELGRLEFAHLAGEFFAYGPKVESFIRSFVYLDAGPAKAGGTLLIYDKVSSARAEFKKVWRLNTASIPQIEGSGFRAVASRGGRMVGRVLLPTPENQVLALVPPEKAFETDGYPYLQDPARGTLNSADTFGWRIELSPKVASREDRFLVVLSVNPGDGETAPLAVSARKGEFAVQVDMENWTILFPKERTLMGNSFEVEGTAKDGRRKLLLTGLASGRWRIFTGGVAETHVVQPGEHLLYLEGISLPLSAEPCNLD